MPRPFRGWRKEAFGLFTFTVASRGWPRAVELSGAIRRHPIRSARTIAAMWDRQLTPPAVRALRTHEAEMERPEGPAGGVA